MSGTQVRMDRSTTKVNGLNKYQILATCTVKGTLPDAAIFLLQINTATDPKDDSLIRVAQIADTTVADTSRTAQIAAGLTTWRSNSVLLQYDDIETGNAAWKELSGRINALVQQVDTYLDEFSTLPAGQTIVYPNVDPTTEAALKSTYATSAAAVTTAEEARDAEIADCSNLKNDIDVIEERLLEAQSDLTVYTLVQAQLTNSIVTYQSIQPTMATAVNTVRIVNSSSSASASEKAAIDTQLSVLDAQGVTFTATNSNLAALRAGPVSTAVSTLQSRVATLTTNRNTSQAEYNRCVARAATLQGQVDAARTARDAALAAVRAVCPTFIP